MTTSQQMIESISIHSLLAEGDQDGKTFITVAGVFQSTPSSRRETAASVAATAAATISIHSLLAEGDYIRNSITYNNFISIHSLLAEGDGNRSRDGSSHAISIHSLLAEGDTRRNTIVRWRASFQSTPSSRRETPAEIR